MRITRKFPRNSGMSGWVQLLGDSRQYPRLEDPKTADIVVVGAGFSGLAAAYRLHQMDPTLRISLIEAWRVGHGPVGRLNGNVCDVPHIALAETNDAHSQEHVIEMHRTSQGIIQHAAEEFEMPAHVAHREGKLLGAASAKAAAKNAQVAQNLQTLGEAFETWDTDQVCAMTGTQLYQSALYLPGAMALQPAEYATRLASGLSTKGVEIYENSPVMSVRRDGFGWHVRTIKGEITAAQVILAVNGFVEGFGFAEKQLKHKMRFAAMTPVLAPDHVAQLGDQSDWSLSSALSDGGTLRRITTPNGDTRVVVRFGEISRKQINSTKRDTAWAANLLRAKVNAALPQLRGAGFDNVWSYQTCHAVDRATLVEELETGLFASAGDNGSAAIYGTLSGIAAAEMCLRHSSEVTDFFLRQDRLAYQKPHPLGELGENIGNRWRDRKMVKQ